MHFLLKVLKANAQIIMLRGCGVTWQRGRLQIYFILSVLRCDEILEIRLNMEATCMSGFKSPQPQAFSPLAFLNIAHAI